MFHLAFTTNIGLAKTQNEDTVLIKNELIKEGEKEVFFDPSEGNIIAIICDGVSGSLGGKIASEMACESLKELENISYDDNQKITELLRKTHQHLRDYSHANNHYINMATTVVGVILNEDKSTIFNLGDSRVYIYKFGVLRQLTTDHTLYNELLSMNLIKEDDTTVNRHQLTKFLGGKDIIVNPSIKVNQGRIIDKEILLLCSDGLTDFISDERIEQVISNNESLIEKIHSLSNDILKEGAKDNFSIILIEKM